MTKLETNKTVNTTLENVNVDENMKVEKICIFSTYKELVFERTLYKNGNLKKNNYIELGPHQMLVSNNMYYYDENCKVIDFLNNEVIYTLFDVKDKLVRKKRRNRIEYYDKENRLLMIKYSY